MPVVVSRHGDEYTAKVTAPQVRETWETDRSYPRDELRRKIESLGVHPIDVADAFHQADRRAGEDPAFTETGRG